MSQLNEILSTRWYEVLIFLLVLGRTSGLVISAPFWGGRVVPGLVRVVVAVSLSVAVYPLVETTSFSAGQELGEPSLFFLLMALGGEILLGLALGWTAQLLFAGMRLAGSQIEFKMGFAMARLIDPQQGGQTGVVAVLFDIITALIFFAVNGHLLLVRALASSYSLFPLAGEKPDFARMMLDSAGGIFTIAVQVSAPVVVGLLLSNLVLGVVSRAVPQMHIFHISMPLQIGFGMLLILLSLPFLISFVTNQLSANPLLGPLSQAR